MKNPTRELRLNNHRLILTCLFLCELPVSADVISKVSSVKDVHHQIEVLPVLKSVVHVDYEGVVELSQYLPLIHY